MRISFLPSLFFPLLITINSYAKKTKDLVNPDICFRITPNDTITPKKEDNIFIAVKQNPEFPGGYDAMTRFIKYNISYSKEAKEKKIEGRVVIQAIIEKDGKIGNTTVLRGLGYGLDEIAVDIVKSMPGWKPGYHEGQPVRVFETINIPFTLNKSTRIQESVPQNTKSLEVNTVSNKDTIYFTKDWKETDSQPEAAYYNVLRKSAKGLNRAALSTYYISGQIKAYIPYSNYTKGIVDGKVLSWYENGKLKAEINYSSGLLSGEALTYWENEKPKRIDLYENNTLVHGKCYDLYGTEVTHLPLPNTPLFTDEY